VAGTSAVIPAIFDPFVKKRKCFIISMIVLQELVLHAWSPLVLLCIPFTLIPSLLCSHFSLLD
jgi:hypothetical protein